jgi:hypothetical protein
MGKREYWWESVCTKERPEAREIKTKHTHFSWRRWIDWITNRI